MKRRVFVLDVALLAAAIVLAMIIAFAVATLGMRIPDATAMTIAEFLAISGSLTLVLGGFLLWLASGPLAGLRPQMTVAMAAGSVVALLNVLVTAWLMFISPHDLALLLLLLLFSLLVSLSFAAVSSRALMASVKDLTTAARRLADGDLSGRVASVGRGELAELAEDFNRMAERVEASFLKERELDAARTSFVASVSHDLRSPLASIRAAVEALHDGVVTDPELVRRYLRTTLQDLTYLSRMIDDLFELARLEGGGLVLDLADTSLGDLISDTLESTRLRAEQRGVTMTGVVAEDLTLRLDGAKIQRVLDNLVDNALRHTPPGGMVEIVAQRQNGGGSVEVRDTGAGIDPADLPFVFDRFFRGDPARDRASGGAGLGLAIARGFVEAHGGRIWAESRLGCGTTVFFTLGSGAAHSSAIGVSC